MSRAWAVILCDWFNLHDWFVVYEDSEAEVRFKLENPLIPVIPLSGSKGLQRRECLRYGCEAVKDEIAEYRTEYRVRQIEKADGL